MYEASRVFPTPHGNIHDWISHTGDDLPWLTMVSGLWQKLWKRDRNTQLRALCCCVL